MSEIEKTIESEKLKLSSERKQNELDEIEELLKKIDSFSAEHQEKKIEEEKKDTTPKETKKENEKITKEEKKPTKEEPEKENKEVKKTKETKSKDLEKKKSVSSKKKKKKKKKSKKMKRKMKKQITNLIIFLLFLVGIILLVYSSIELLNWYRDSKKTKEIAKDVQSNVQLEEVKEEDSNNNVEIIEPDVKPDKSNPYWDYIKMNLIDVDFTELKKTNQDIVGWIQVNGTNINYPFVQTTNNSYYLTHSFDKSKNSAGWVFLDYRNNLEILHQNTILYAHGRYDKTMFGSLNNLLKNKWYNDLDNHIIKLSTESQNTLWQVFSVYHIPTTSDYLQITFGSGAEFKEFADMLIKRSVFDFHTTVGENDKILTLSTCYNDQEKMVMHAKLIKIQNK